MECAIFISVSEHLKVINIWFELNGPDSEKQAALMLALKSLSKIGSFLYVDWGWACFFKLNDEDGLAKYLIQREERFNRPVFSTQKIEPIEEEISGKINCWPCRPNLPPSPLHLPCSPLTAPRDVKAIIG